MTTTTFTDGVTPVVAAWLNDVDAATYETLPNHIADTLDAHAASAITNTPAGSIAATTVQAAINELDTEKQPVDAELTALAGLTSAANKVPRFTGSGTAEVIDVEYGTYTPTLTAVDNTSALSVLGSTFRYTRIGNIVHISGSIQGTTTTSGVLSRITLTLPVASNLTSSYQVAGTGVAEGASASVVASIYGDIASDVGVIAFYAIASATVNTMRFTCSYEIL